MIYDGGRCRGNPCRQCDKWQEAIGEECVNIGVCLVVLLVLKEIYVGVGENLYVLGLLQNRIIQ